MTRSRVVAQAEEGPSSFLPRGDEMDGDDGYDDDGDDAEEEKLGAYVKDAYAADDGGGGGDDGARQLMRHSV